jgi:hypothetical protein
LLHASPAPRDFHLFFDEQRRHAISARLHCLSCRLRRRFSFAMLLPAADSAFRRFQLSPFSADAACAPRPFRFSLLFSLAFFDFLD